MNQAQQVVANLEAQENQQQARLQSVQRQVNQIENQIEAQVRDVNQELNRRENLARVQVEQIDRQIAANMNRVNVIASIEIPQQQNIINSLSNERPSVQARYDQDGPVANRLENELNAFEVRVGWDAKVQAVRNGENLVAQRSNELNRSLSQKSTLDAQIARCQQERTRLANVLVQTQNSKLQAEQRLAQVIQSLVPYDQEKARLEQQDGDLRNQLATIGQDFESKLP